MKTKEAKADLTGAKLIRAAVNQIIEHPETWNQRDWHCGTKHCIGGWCQIKGGRKESTTNVITDVEELLGISYSEASWLCAGNRTFGEIYNFAAGFDRAGRDRAGVKPKLFRI